MNRLTTESLLAYIQQNLGLKNKTNTSDENVNDTNESMKENFKKLEFGNYQNLSFIENEFNEILNEYSLNLIRYGVLHKETINYSEDNNISLHFSLMMIIKHDYKSLPKEQQLLCIQKFTEKMLLDISSRDLFKKFDYQLYSWTRAELVTEIKKYTLGKRILKFISDYLFLNIWIFNYETDEIMLCYCNDKVNKYRNNIVIFYNQDVYEPISFDGNFIMDIECPLIEHLFNNIETVIPMQFNFGKDDTVLELGHDDLTRLSIKKEGKVNGKDAWLVNRFKYEHANEEKNKIEIEKEQSLVEANCQSKENEKKQSTEQTAALAIENKLCASKNDIDKVADEEDSQCSSDDDINTEQHEKLTKSIFTKKDTSKLEYVDNIDDEDTIDTAVDIVESVSMKMKLDELQQIATGHKISITSIVNGKQKNKTKEQLVIEITKCTLNK